MEENSAAKVLDVRKLFGMSNLLDVPKISYVASYRAQNKNTSIDPFVLFAWQRMCELMTNNIDIADQVNVDLLREKIPDIKQCMFLRVNQIQKRLTSIFSECGIAFRIVPNFTGAPVQGFIKKSEGGSLILCVTLRQKFADIFWFTLFHEVAHILNGDASNLFVDFDSVSNELESQADRIASEILINSKDYLKFVKTKKYASSREIELFAESQGVKDYIIRGRLMKDEVIPWGNRLRYEWG